jgi:proline iminopeptidase
MKCTLYKALSLLFVLILFGCTKSEDFEELVPKTVIEDSSLPSFTVSNGIKLHLETFGDPNDTMLLILHGGPGADYQGLIKLKELSNDFFVVFFDQRGSGLSQRLSIEQLSPDLMLNDINDIKQHFSPSRKMYLLGHSWGGALASYYVQQYPENVSKLLLAEPGALYKEAAQIANTTAFQFSASGLHQMLNSNQYLSYENDNIADYKMSVFINSDVGDYRDVAKPEELKKLAYTRFGFFVGYEINKWQGNFDATYSFDFATGIKERYFGKTMIIGTSKSQRLGYDFQNEYHRTKFNNCQMVKIENAGHFFIEMNPNTAIPIIRDFFMN